MKKTFRSLAMVALAALTLCSCLSKTDYDSFHSAATSVESVSYTKATFKGKVKASSLTVDLDNTYDVASKTWSPSLDLVSGVIVAAMLLATPATVAKSDTATYYCGGGFKVEDGDTTTEWNEYGYLTSIKNGDNKLTASWSK